MSIYQNDFYQWTQEQADLLRQGAFPALDVENLIEEIESMGRSDRRSIRSHLANVILHLLKWRYQPGKRTSSWEDSVENGREEVAWLLKDSPSLKGQLTPFVDEVYSGSRRKASRETGLPLTTFPDQCPFTVEQITGDYWPE